MQLRPRKMRMMRDSHHRLIWTNFILLVCVILRIFFLYLTPNLFCIEAFSSNSTRLKSLLIFVFHFEIESFLILFSSFTFSFMTICGLVIVFENQFLFAWIILFIIILRMGIWKGRVCAFTYWNEVGGVGVYKDSIRLLLGLILVNTSM